MLTLPTKNKKNKTPLKDLPVKTPMQKKSPLSSLPKISNVLLGIVLIFALYTFLTDTSTKKQEISLSSLISDIKSGNIENILIEGETLKATYRDKVEKESRKEPGLSFSETLSNYGVNPSEVENFVIEIKEPNSASIWLWNLLPIVLPILLIGGFIWYMARQARGAGMQALTFGQSKARLIDPNDKNQRITFKDVAGVKEAKEELVEIVDFLRNPKKFLDIGARIPKGVLLVGAPGTGKTLLARAVAGEAAVPFFSISGSEFVEMFVGVGASRVRDLFSMAKKAAPSIIFVDEIDAVGRVRGSGVGGGNDEREQTLNQILVEMDGFEPTEKVIVMAASNRPDVLDPALLRPGRFDRRVVLDLPDRSDREEILNIHARKKPLAEDVDLKVIAQRTPGFSGADLYSLMNEGAILAAREERKKVSQYDLIRSIEKVMIGPERKSHLMSIDEKKTAYHEAGHALIASVHPDADPVHKISIISRGRALGYVLHLPLEEKKMKTKKSFMADLAVTLGGYVVEDMIFGDISTGPSNDLQVATAKARDMVTRFGMSEKIGPIALENDSGVPIYGRGGEKEYSEAVGTIIDSEVSRIIELSKKEAEKIIKTHKKLLDNIAKTLIEQETLEREEFEKLLIKHGIEPKREMVEEV